MNLKLAIVLIALSLSACATRHVKLDSPASDLDVMLAKVKQYAQYRLLPNGKEYCFELSVTEDLQDQCTADLEVSVFYNHADKDDIVLLLQQFVAQQKLARNPCSRWEKFLRRDRCYGLPPPDD